jgi:hypothetical protein
MTTSQLGTESAERLFAGWRDWSDGQPEVLARFTDEELAAVSGPGQDQVAPMLWLDRQPHDQHQVFVSIALRGLVARGVVLEIEQQQQQPDACVLTFSAHTQALLAMRHTASSIVIAERQTATGKSAVVLYFGDGRGVLEETVDQAGLHTFSVCTEELALDDLVALCDPDDVAGDSSGPPEVLLEHAVPATLDHALAVTVMAGVVGSADRVGEPRQDCAAVYTFADDVKVAHRPSGASELLVRRVSRAALREVVGALSGRGHGHRR